MARFDDLLWEAEAAITEIRNYHSVGAAFRLKVLAEEIERFLEENGER